MPEALFIGGAPKIIEAQYSNDKVLPFLLYGCLIIQHDLVSFYGVGTSQRLGRVVEQRDIKKLKRFLAEDDEKAIPTNYYALLELIVQLTLNYSGDVKGVVEMYNIEGKVDDDELDSISFILDYADEHILPAIRKKYEKGYKVRGFKVSKAFKDEVPGLIKGYGKYLQAISLGSSKRKAALKVEQDVGIANVRQEFHSYDSYFDELATIVKEALPAEIPNTFSIRNDLKEKLLSNAYDLAF